jgi:hypothetical protein
MCVSIYVAISLSLYLSLCLCVSAYLMSEMKLYSPRGCNGGGNIVGNIVVNRHVFRDCVQLRGIEGKEVGGIECVAI